MRRLLKAALCSLAIGAPGSPALAEPVLRNYLATAQGAAESARAREQLALVSDLLEGLQRSEGVRVCATALWPAITDLKSDLSPAGQAALGAALGALGVRPVLDTFYDVPQAPFRVHYSVTGASAVLGALTDTAADGRPRYVHTAASALVRAWDLLIDSLGYPQPLGDNDSGGGLNLYDCYLDLSPYAGYTSAELWYGHVVGGDTVRIATAYMVVNSDMSSLPISVDPFDYLSITCAHEFFHFIHFSYDLDEKPVTWQQFGFWLEGTAVWFEDYAYPNVNDWAYLPYYLHDPERSLSYSPPGSGSVRPYGAGSMWVFYLVERFGGPGVLKDIWNRCGQVSGDNTFAATDSVLVARGSSLDEGWHEFATWCLRTGSRWQAGSFAQGAQWPQVQPTVTLLSYPSAVHFTDGSDNLDAALDPVVPVVTITATGTPVAALGFAALAHVPFPTTRPDSSQHLYVQTLPALPVQFAYLGKDTSAATPAVELASLPAGDTTLLPSWLRFDTLWVVASAGLHYDAGSDSDDPPAAVTALLSAALDRAGLNVQQVQFTDPYPNPLVLPEAAGVQFVAVLPQAAAVHLDVFTVAGLRVRSLSLSAAAWPPVSVIWDGRNDQGTEVASGLYLCKITVDLSATGERAEKLYRVGVVR
jgi:hypothetical protein